MGRVLLLLGIFRLFTSTERGYNNLVAGAAFSSRHFSTNIVLSPETEDGFFDSYKLGAPRVIIGSEEESSNSSRDDDRSRPETAVRMWYHGRSKEMQLQNPKLPPISTGRIGSASWDPEGEKWIKHGVVLDLNHSNRQAFDSAHIGMGSIVVDPRNGGYRMYYHGGNHEETLIQEYMDRKLPQALQEATIRGMKMRIGMATSPDGVVWKRVVDGDDPTGACLVPTDWKTCSSTQNDQEELYCGWPEVVQVSTNRYHMYYTTMLKKSKEKCISLAVSEDGFQWTKQGVCIRPAVKGLDQGGCARCCVVRDAVFDTANREWKDLDQWKLYYEGVAEDGKHRILMAESSNGEKWEKAGIIALDVGADEDWDCAGVSSPHIIRCVVCFVPMNRMDSCGSWIYGY